MPAALTSNSLARSTKAARPVRPEPVRAVPPPRPVRTTLPAVPAAIPVHPANDQLEAEANAVAGSLTGRAPARALPPAAPAGPPSTSVPPAPPIVHAALASPGQPLDHETRASLEPHLGRDLAAVRVHTGPLAEQSARALEAQAFTIGQDVFFDSGRYEPRTRRGHWLLAHEIAHTVQQRSPGTTRVQRQPNNLGSYPEAERRSIVQSNIPTPMLDAAFLLSVFGTAAQNGGATTSYTFGGTTVFGTGIDPAIQRGLTSTGAYLAGQTNVLPLGSTVTVHLDLTPFKGPNGSFRFSHFTHTETAKPAAPLLLVESTGPAPATIAAATVPTGSFTVRTQSFNVGGGWNDQQFGRLMAVLAKLPDSVLQEASGITFSLRGQGTPDEAGKYEAATDEIVIHQNAFPVSSTTYGGGDYAMYAITHEVGHLLDLRRLERAWRTFDKGGQTAAGKTQLLKERSLSGSRYKDPGSAPNATFDQVDDRTTVAGNDFRAAAQKDGIKPGKTGSDPLTGGITAYSNTDWQELFAESFALYVNDPNLFRVLRPNLYQYFVSRFPPPAQASTSTSTSGTGTGAGRGSGSTGGTQP
jgi:Domain of unknown function (DUF4157)